MKRPAQPRELAPIDMMLASDEASSVSGTMVGVTGGKPNSLERLQVILNGKQPRKIAPTLGTVINSRTRLSSWARERNRFSSQHLPLLENRVAPPERFSHCRQRGVTSDQIADSDAEGSRCRRPDL
jgi:hypothetical protein